ncbi:MAG TPA: bifunctional methylenetetrahydrofolate dehydrogenase/methenyltetrahydrofolate cyclohydrolase FolD [Isosphaeraceae bacterium]|nr:bifunctional methylenetetrahydrofolate dehydrogenase/methenyltetrahydrofolate cyclohydrolase FolD [Isosphaeraceae bacterium]
MAAKILDGAALARTIRGEVAEEVGHFKGWTGATPALTAVLVGDDPASRVYVRNKRKACEEAGMVGRVVNLAADVAETELIDRVDALNADPEVHGILVQLPLPRQIDERRVVERVNPLKDVDGFHPENAGLLATGRPRFVPCTPLGIRTMLVAAEVETKGARAVVLGRSNVVGKPMALLLLEKGRGGDATVTVCHTGTKDAAAIAREADILIAAVGRPEHVRGDWIKAGAVVIDVGIHRRDDGGLCGDVHHAEAAAVAGWISPVPGGVGPMTVAMLLQNTLRAARLQLGG